MPTALPIKPVAAEIRLRNVISRMPGKYGATISLGAPLAHLWLTVEGPDGKRVEGLAGDCLPRGWYDKTPGRTFQQDIKELSAAIVEAQKTLLSLAKSGPRSVFDLWHDLYKHQISWARTNKLSDLTGNLGTSMMERAMIDAAGKLSGRPYHACVRENILGIDGGRIHPFLKNWSAAKALAPEPRAYLHVRHTVGGIDPLVASDVPEGKRLNDGLPQTLEEYLKAEHLRYFKVKLEGNEAKDVERMRRIANVCDELIPQTENYFVTLDGNEQYFDPAILVRVLERMTRGDVSARFARAVLFVEQPYPRTVALEDGVKAELAAASKIKPVIIDESDENVDCVPRALELGYAGYAIKSAKGPIKALLNKGAVQCHPKRPANGIVSGEDMMNMPVAPLHVDLVVMAAMGVEHIERNGHHFNRGLDHCTPKERAALLKAHPSLYHKKAPDLDVLATESGTLDVRTLNARPGFGIDGATEIDRESMPLLSEWKFESLGL
jgi:hypothetical protein